MTGSAPSWLLTASLWAVSFTGVMVFVNVLTRWGPFRWIWERLVTTPRREQLGSVIDERVLPLMEQHRSTLQATLAELRPNGGGSLRDALDTLHQDVRENNLAAEQAVVAAGNAAHAAEGAVEAAERAAAKVDAFEHYQRDRNHDVLGQVAVVNGFSQLLGEKVTAYMEEDAAAHMALQAEFDRRAELGAAMAVKVDQIAATLAIHATVDDHGRAHEIERRHDEPPPVT